MAEAEEADAPDDTKVSSLRKPNMLADNGHGTKVKLWNNKGKNGEFQTVSIERSYKDGDAWKTQVVTLNADDLLSVAHALTKGHDLITEKHIGQRTQGRA